MQVGFDLAALGFQDDGSEVLGIDKRKRGGGRQIFEIHLLRLFLNRVEA